MLSTSAQALKIPVQRPPVQVRPVLTHLAALTNQLPLATLVFYGRHGEPRTVLFLGVLLRRSLHSPGQPGGVLRLHTQREAACNATVRDTLAAALTYPDMLRSIVEAATYQFDPTLVEPPF